MNEIKASILGRSDRKFWYIKYQVFTENNDFKFFEESTKILKSEKNIKYMQTIYLPAWLARKKEAQKLKKNEIQKFSYYFQKFLKNHHEDKSYENRLYLYNKVNLYFGNFEVYNINRLQIKEFLAKLEIKDASKKKYLSCIRGVLDIALDNELISRNVALNIQFRRTEKTPVEPFSPEEVAYLLDNSEGMFRNFIGIALNTGMRSGEILGLMHSDILTHKIQIKRSISRGNITSPKTIGSVRDIPMFEAAKPFIESQMKLSNSLYLFDRDKHFINDVSFFRSQWDLLVKVCNIKYRTIYNTRHSFITAMLNSGKFKIMDIAAIVGHNSPQMIMTHYAGFIEDCHLKVDTSVELFSDTSGDTLKIMDLEKVLHGGQRGI